MTVSPNPPAKPMTPISSAPCPCDSGRPFGACCAPYLRGEALPPGAEALMRSRYCAFALEDEAYLLATWHPATRPVRLDLDQEPRPKWLGLRVKARAEQDPDHATVTFVARYKIAGRGHRLQEVSRFERRDGRWYYLDGEVS